MVNNINEYKDFCDKEMLMPIFNKYWWMDAVCGKNNWNVILYEDKNGTLIASFVYYITERKKILKIISQPKLTQISGLYIKYPENQSTEKKISFENKIISFFINKLEELKYSRLSINLNYRYTNWLQFYWNGFSQTTRYTYVIEGLSDLETVYKKFSNKRVRSILKKAVKLVSVETDLCVDKFYDVNKLTFKRQDKSIPYSKELLERIFTACKKNNSGKTFYATDSNGNIHGAIFVVWDSNTAYYLLSGSNPEYRSSGANSLLIWESIKYVSTFVNRYDFEGSMIESIESAFRAFGTTQIPYFNISKTNSRLFKLRQLSKGIIR